MNALLCPHCQKPIRVLLEPAAGHDLTELFTWLPRRVYNALRRRGIMTVEQLQARSWSELRNMVGIGPRALDEIDYALSEWEATHKE